MLTLGEELILVALDADKGVIRRSAGMRFALNAAGLADLLASGWLTLRWADGSPRVTVLAEGDSRVGEDSLLTEALEQARETREGQRHPELCILNWLTPSLFAYLKSLRDREVLTWERPKSGAIYGRFRLLDAEAAATARARVERVTTGNGPSERDLDLAGIVQALGLGGVLYKGFRNRSKREALATAVAKQRFAMLLARALPQVPGQKFTFDSSNDEKMAREIFTAWHGTP